MEPSTLTCKVIITRSWFNQFKEPGRFKEQKSFGRPSRTGLMNHQRTSHKEFTQRTHLVVLHWRPLWIL